MCVNIGSIFRVKWKYDCGHDRQPRVRVMNYTCRSIFVSNFTHSALNSLWSFIFPWIAIKNWTPKLIFMPIFSAVFSVATKVPQYSLRVRCRVTWHALLQTVTPSAKRTQNDGEKPHFPKFVSPKQRIVSPTSRRPFSVKFEHKTWIDVIINSFRAELRHFPIRDHLAPKTSFLVFRHTCIGCYCANLNIAPYSRRTESVSPVTLSYWRFRDIGVQSHLSFRELREFCHISTAVIVSTR